MKLPLCDPAQSTHSGLNMPAVPRLPGIVVSGALLLSSTASAQPDWTGGTPILSRLDATTSGEQWQDSATDDQIPPREVTRRALSELRLISGLTFEQLGQLFHVSRRSVHLWISGRALNPDHERRLWQILAIMRTADRGYAHANRSALTESCDGISTFDLLAAGRFDEARTRLGVGKGRRRYGGELSPEAKAARMPLRPEELVEARHERVHRDVGIGRAARTVRNMRREIS